MFKPRLTAYTNHEWWSEVLTNIFFQRCEGTWTTVWLWVQERDTKLHCFPLWHPRSQCRSHTIINISFDFLKTESNFKFNFCKHMPQNYSSINPDFWGLINNSLTMMWHDYNSLAYIWNILSWVGAGHVLNLLIHSLPSCWLSVNSCFFESLSHCLDTHGLVLPQSCPQNQS